MKSNTLKTIDAIFMLLLVVLPIFAAPFIMANDKLDHYKIEVFNCDKLIKEYESYEKPKETKPFGYEFIDINNNHISIQGGNNLAVIVSKKNIKIIY
jgi:hypothetical protein